MAETIGKRILEIRKIQELSQEDLCARSNLSVPVLQKIEGSDIEPDEETLKQIGAALGMSISTLMIEEVPQIQGSSLLPFQSLTADRFEDLVVNILLPDKENYTDIQKYAGRGDKQRDVIARKIIGGSVATKYTLFQAKRHANITLHTLKEELDGIKEHFFDDPSPATPIDSICFCVSTHASPEVKDNTKLYARELGLPEPIFWDQGILNAACEQNDKIISIFFGGYIGKILSNQEEMMLKMGEMADMLSQQLKMSLSPLGSLDDQKMAEAKQMIVDGKYAEAKEVLIRIQNTVEYSGDKEKMKKLLNNLGVCYINTSEVKRGIEYFHEALKIDPTFLNPKQNLVAAYINYPEFSDLELAANFAREAYLAQKDNLEYLGNYLYALCLARDYDSVEKLIESEEVMPDKVKINELVSISVSLFYIGKGNFPIAEKHLTESLVLFPKSGILHNLLGEVTMTLAEHGGVRVSTMYTVAFHNRPDLLDLALGYFHKALLLLPTNNPIRNSIKFNIYVCEALLCKLGIYRHSENGLDIDELSSDSRRQYNIIKFSILLENDRDFEGAYSLFKKTYESEKPTPTYEMVKDVGLKFFHFGSPENSIKVLSWIDGEARSRQDLEYWTYLSMSYVLLGKKSDAMTTLHDAMEVFKDDPVELPRLLSHRAALFMRYSDNSESDRMIADVFELDKLQPEKKIITAIPAVNVQSGELTEEIQTMFANRQKNITSQKKLFLDNTLPTYALCRFFDRSFPEVINMVRESFDFEFTLPYNNLGSDFEEKRGKLFDSNEKFVVDYSTLLNLARCGQLSIFKNLGKKIVVSQTLLFDVQRDFLENEDKSLEDLWNFLRKGDIETFPLHDFSKKILPPPTREFFAEWLIQEIEYCVKEDYVFMTDDLLLSNYVNGEEVKGKSINSFILFQRALLEKKIDRKQYSLILAEYADSLYHFLPFDGEDLFNIVLDDENKMRNGTSKWVSFSKYGTLKISRRAFQLINQAHMPGSSLQSFLAVCEYFLSRLFDTGVLDETKLDWVLFLTNYFSEFISDERIEKDPGSIKEQDIHDILVFMVRSWGSLRKILGVIHRDKIIEKSNGIINATFREKMMEFLDKFEEK